MTSATTVRPVTSYPAPPSPPALWRRLVAEAVGTGLLVTAIIGSGVAAARLSPHDAGLQQAYNAAAVAVALAVLVLVFVPVSGAHLNPAVTLVAWWEGRRRSGAAVAAGSYLAAQIAGAVAGAMLANLMFDLPAVAMSGTGRDGAGVWLGEVVATAGLVLVIGAISRTGATRALPLAVGGWIGAAFWFTSSTAFANPAVTVGRMFTDTATGIAPASAPAFIAAQLVGAAVGAGLVSLLWPGKESA